MGLLLAIVGTLSFTVGFLYVVFRAFETGILWGLGCLLFAPVALVFTVLHWDEAKTGALAFFSGIGVLLVGGAIAGA
ncbi:MAG: hypothetical protein AAF791_11455 [Bacteroidota bacterium]